MQYNVGAPHRDKEIALVETDRQYDWRDSYRDVSDSLRALIIMQPVGGQYDAREDALVRGSILATYITCDIQLSVK